ncbi:hypothetical protein H6F93_32310 [Leptolyngbya sp. FACHB-671]|uniref:hypothetical protein n=1 Tax=Leptolyngbya sp. FACHB-671 TaxID=2692812 RepID=UPI001684FD8D|nr:hypothetical protein [Leptolyngbya sp. FACHB-671]MBD2072154.1 hypothetical protein [Leptolyngbya sp. FACHB-671]
MDLTQKVGKKLKKRGTGGGGAVPAELRGALIANPTYATVLKTLAEETVLPQRVLQKI